MKINSKTATICAAGLLICGCVTSPDTNRSPPAVTRTNTATIAHTLFQKIEQQLPELSLAGRPTPYRRPPEYGKVEKIQVPDFSCRRIPDIPRWNSLGKENAVSGSSGHIARYPSSRDAQHALQSSLFQRPALTPPKENYRGASLYRYTSGGGTTICHAGEYIIEINPYSEGARPLTMKVLDIVLGELDRAP